MNSDRTNTLKDTRKGERGSVLAMTALSMFSLLLAAGLAIDISHFYTAKAELQNAADAAALAAASQLNSTSGGIQCAVTEATKALNNYDFKNIVTITSSDVTFAQNLNGSYVGFATAMVGGTITMPSYRTSLPGESAGFVPCDVPSGTPMAPCNIIPN
jgi:Flp pilus assembly protein TadG